MPESFEKHFTKKSGKSRSPEKIKEEEALKFEAKFMQPPLQQLEEAPPKSEACIEVQPFLGEFHIEIDKSGEYKEPTSEQKEWFKKRIERVSEIFENADFPWYLDGAPNISLYGDKQIRHHKDLDISVFKEDLAKLEKLLAEQGFGIFVNYKEKGKNLMRKVTAKEIATLENSYLSICKIGPDGKIKRETEDPFNFVDLHVHSKDAEGNTVIFYNGVTLPKEFFKPIKKELPNGKKINLSQPAIVAYHKLHSNRPYDLMDLQKLRPYLQQKDFQMLRKSLEEEIEKTEKMVGEKLQEVWDSLVSILRLTPDQKVMSEKLWGHPDLQKRKSDQKVSEFVSLISQYLSENPNASFEDFLSRSEALLKPREQVEQKLKIIDQLEKS